MREESQVNVVRNYALMMGAGLAGSVLGAFFSVIVVLIAPDTFGAANTGTAQWRDIRAAAAFGMVSGFFVGALVMGYCLILTVLAIWFRPRNIEKHWERERWMREREERERTESASTR